MISVVIPAYNAEKTIKRCLDSLLKQTYGDIELIVVDDGSTDNTAQIVSEMILTDPRIRLIKQENSGPGVARNSGIDAARGELLTFVDADDTVSENFVQTLFSLYSTDILPAVDIVRTDISGSALSPIEKEITLDDGWIDRYFCSDIRYGIAVSVWNKLFSLRTLRLHSIKFRAELRMGEDMLFVFEYLCHCRKICFDGNAHYGYIIASDTLTSLSKDYAPLYQSTFDAMKSFECIGIDTLNKWAFAATVDLILRPFVLNKPRSDFAAWWKSFRQTPLCQAAIKSEKPKSIKNRLFHFALRFKRPTCVYALLTLMRIKKRQRTKTHS